MKVTRMISWHGSLERNGDSGFISLSLLKPPLIIL